MRLITECPPIPLLMDSQCGLAFLSVKFPIVNRGILFPVDIGIDIVHIRLVSAGRDQVGTSTDQFQPVEAPTTKCAMSVCLVPDHALYFNHSMDLVMTAFVSELEEVYERTSIA